MSDILIESTPKIVFVLVDSSGIEVAGLGTTFTLSISKNGGVFTPGAGTKGEIGNGWYHYSLLSSETDTSGPLAIKASGTGTIQQNLFYKVVGAIFEPGEGPNILSTAEAATVLRCEEDDPNMLMLLPQVNAYLRQATGRSWEEDEPVHDEAKSAARMLLVMWHKTPAMIGAGLSGLSFGLPAALMQLKVLGMELAETEGSS